MKTEQFKLLTDVHVQQQIWRNELEMALMELDFWEKLLATVAEEQGQEVLSISTWTDTHSQLHHFQRLARRLLVEVQEVDKLVAEGVQNNQVLDQPTRTDHKYLREQMDLFHTNYQNFRTTIRQFVVAQADL